MTSPHGYHKGFFCWGKRLGSPHPSFQVRNHLKFKFMDLSQKAAPNGCACSSRNIHQVRRYLHILFFLLSRFFFFEGLISQQTKRPCNFPRLIRWHDILVSIGASRPYVASEADVVVDTPFVAPTLRPPRSAAGRPWGNTGRKPESAALHRWSGLYVLYVAGGGFLKGILKGASNRCFFFQTFLFLVMLNGDMYCGKACNY